MYKFTDLTNAENFANRTQDMVVMLGTDSQYWVVTMAQAAKLERQGIEYAS